MRKGIFREGIAPAIIRFTIGFMILVVIAGVLYFLVDYGIFYQLLGTRTVVGAQRFGPFRGITDEKYRTENT